MLLPAFVLASLAGRGGRFFLVAALCAYGGPRMQSVLKQYVDRIGWGVVVVGLVWFLIHRFG